MSIYTKSGDKGETGLVSRIPGKVVRVAKDSQVIRTIGSIDEANSYLGIIIAETKDKTLISTLKHIQNNLFTIGSILAGSDLLLPFSETTRLEKLIDEIDKKINPLTNFILPGGTPVAAKLHYARTIVRRAERELVTLHKDKDLPPEVMQYINRLSDTLFTLARFENYKAGVKEETWIGRK
jgi:cob(I)alamin adenosyltransferase